MSYLEPFGAALGVKLGTGKKQEVLGGISKKTGIPAFRKANTAVRCMFVADYRVTMRSIIKYS